MESLRYRQLLCIVGVCFLAGCGSRGDRPQLGTVTGIVYLDEKPLPDVWVMFCPSSGRTSIGRTNKNGQYTLQYLEKVSGANIGTHKVMILTYNEDELEELKASTKRPVKDPIPEKYNSATTLSEQVKAGNNVINFRLASK